MPFTFVRGKKTDPKNNTIKKKYKVFNGYKTKNERGLIHKASNDDKNTNIIWELAHNLNNVTARSKAKEKLKNTKLTNTRKNTIKYLLRDEKGFNYNTLNSKVLSNAAMIEKKAANAAKAAAAAAAKAAATEAARATSTRIKMEGPLVAPTNDKLKNGKPNPWEVAQVAAAGNAKARAAANAKAAANSAKAAAAAAAANAEKKAAASPRGTNRTSLSNNPAVVPTITKLNPFAAAAAAAKGATASPIPSIGAANINKLPKYKDDKGNNILLDLNKEKVYRVINGKAKEFTLTGDANSERSYYINTDQTKTYIMDPVPASPSSPLGTGQPAPAPAPKPNPAPNP